MSDMSAAELAALSGALDDLLGDRADPMGVGYDADLWSVLAEAGLTTIGLPEQLGGSGGSLTAAVAVARQAGAYAVRVPLADSALVAGWLLASAGLQLPAGPVSTGDGLVSVDGARMTVHRVPYASHAERVVALTADGAVLALPPTELSIEPGHNLAGEDRDDVTFDRAQAGVGGAPVGPAGSGVAAELRLRGALARAALIAGALTTVQRMVVTYAQEREQFGRPIARFQAVQHQIATLVTEAAAAGAAVDGAVRTWESRGAQAPQTAFAVAATKVRTAQAAGQAATIAHQVHGAIGMTQEHPLHAWTTRLWSWRSEWGGESRWSVALGDAAVAAGAQGLWPLVEDAS